MSRFDADKDWRGVWLGKGWQLDADPLGERRVAFHWSVRLPARAERAPIRVSAGSRYALWVNGRLAGYGPARSWPRRKIYDELDVAPLLRKGLNHFAALVTGPTGVTGYSMPERVAFLLDGEALCGRRRIPLLTYGGQAGDWQVRYADWIIPSGNMCSLPTAYQEHFDARREPKGWRMGRLDKEWHAAWPVGPVGAPPWKTLEPRPIPLLNETLGRPRLIWRGRASRQMADPAKNLQPLFNELPVRGKATAESSTAWIEAGKDTLFTFDFGRVHYVRPGIEVKGNGGGTRLEFHYDLGFPDRPTAHRGFGTSREGFSETFRPRPSASSWEALSPHGMRYLTVRLTGEGRCAFRLRARTVEYPFADAVRFECDDPFIRSLWLTSIRNLRASTNDAVVDCNSREDSLWNLDACISSKASYHTFGETRMWRRCLSMLGQGIEEDGLAHAVAPAGSSLMMLLDATMHWVISCRDYYLATADRALLEEVAPPMERFLSFCARNSTREGLFVPPLYTWHFIDLTPTDRRPYALPVNALLLLAAQAAGSVAEAAGHGKLQSTSASLRLALSRALPRFYAPKEGCFRDHLEPRVSVPEIQHPGWPAWSHAVQKHSAHGNAFACLAGAGTPAQRHSAAHFLARKLTRPTAPHNYTGPGWTEMILSPLFEHGLEPQAMACIERVYGDALRRGAVTWPEHWNNDRHYVRNTAHGWGAAVNTLIVQRIAGLRPLMPGGRLFLLEPRPELVHSLRYRIETPMGSVEVALENGGVAAAAPKGSAFLCRGTRRSGTGKLMRLT